MTRTLSEAIAGITQRSGGQVASVEQTDAEVVLAELREAYGALRDIDAARGIKWEWWEWWDWVLTHTEILVRARKGAP